MDPKKDLVIVSAFGRGHWICQELLRQGFRVGLVDVSGRLGRWAPEDWEGPFPCFETSHLDPSQRARLVEDEETLALDRGLCLWLKDGPLELKSPLTSFLLRQRKIPSSVEDYLLAIPSESSQQKKARIQELMNLDFKENWLAHFAHQWSSSRYQANHLAMESGQALALFTPCFMRRASRFSFEKSLQEFKRLGGDVILGSELRDLSIQGKNIAAVEVGSDLSGGVLRADNYLWMLSSQETYFLSETIGHLLFPKGPLDPMWVWLRFRVELTEGVEKNALPDHFVMIDHLDLPWTRENFLTCVRAPASNQLDVWMRVPQKQRFQRQDLEEMAAEIILSLKHRMPSSHPKLLEMPQEFLYNYEELGPSRHGVYRSEDIEAHPETNHIQNIKFNSPETWPGLDWNNQLLSQKSLFNQYVQSLSKEEGSVDDHTLHP